MATAAPDGGAVNAPVFRLFVMLVWHPALGAPVDPVGVLGIDERPIAIPKTSV